MSSGPRRAAGISALRAPCRSRCSLRPSLAVAMRLRTDRVPARAELEPLTHDPRDVQRSSVRRGPKDRTVSPAAPPAAGSWWKRAREKLKRAVPRVRPGHFAMRRFQQNKGCILHPHHKSVTNWNLLIGALLLVDAPLLPLQLAFVSDEALMDQPWLLWFTCWSELVFWLDLALQFFLQVQSRDRSHWVADPKYIFCKYMRKEFLLDLIAVLPVKRLALSAMIDAHVAVDPCSCAFSLVGFHKMLRFTRLPRVLKSLAGRNLNVRYLRFTYRQTRLLKSCLVVFFCCHLMGCLWATLAVCGQQSFTWYRYLNEVRKGEINPLYGDNNFTSMYMCAIYWAVFTLTGIGYGDIVPVSPIEYILATIVMFFGSLTWAWVIANIVSIMATMNQAANDHLQTLDCINELLRDNSVKVRLGRRLREYFTKMRDVKEHAFVNEIIDRLSPELKIEMVQAIHSHWIQKIWWLKQVPVNDFIVEMTQRMKMTLHIPNELMPNKQELCIVRQGLCIHGGLLKARGQVFGEDMLLNNESLRKPYATLALTFLHILVMSKPVLNELLAKYVDVAAVIRKCYIVLVVMRGMLYRAELYKRAHRTGVRQSLDFAVVDHQFFNKPAGDCEDVVGDFVFNPAHRRKSRDSPADPSQAHLSPSPTNPRSVVYGSDGSGSVLKRAFSASAGDGIDTVATRGGAQQLGVSLSDINALYDQTASTEANLRTKLATLEDSAQRLLTQARLLDSVR